MHKQGLLATKDKVPRPLLVPLVCLAPPLGRSWGTSVRATPFSLYTGVCGWTHSYTNPNTINYCIFEAIQIHTMAHCHAATVTIFHSQITLTVHRHCYSPCSECWPGRPSLAIFSHTPHVHSMMPTLVL